MWSLGPAADASCRDGVGMMQQFERTPAALQALESDHNEADVE